MGSTKVGKSESMVFKDGSRGVASTLVYPQLAPAA